ncbi:MAG: hypothetical protein KGJ87_11755, partial [Planctomycetota bacterium]|nr:hypothetical protein [Planctomycetota bacterium]
IAVGYEFGAFPLERAGEYFKSADQHLGSTDVGRKRYVNDNYFSLKSHYARSVLTREGIEVDYSPGTPNPEGRWPMSNALESLIYVRMAQTLKGAHSQEAMLKEGARMLKQSMDIVSRYGYHSEILIDCGNGLFVRNKNELVWYIALEAEAQAVFLAAI